MNSCHFCYVIITLNLLIYSAFIRSVKSDSKVKLKFYSNMVTFLYEKECPHTVQCFVSGIMVIGYRKQKSCNQMITTLLWVVMDSNHRS